jgi:3-oxoacyl-[acyl-carrier-protein] synthase III
MHYSDAGLRKLLAPVGPHWKEWRHAFHIAVLEKLPLSKKEIDIVFTHASSKAAWRGFGAKARIEDKMYHVYQETGNLVSASMPAAISMAKESCQLKRSDRVLCWIGSAGMSFNISSFRF